MAEADITATTSGGDRNWSTGATWVGGTKPASDQHAIIPSSAAVTLDGNEEIASLVVNSGGTITGNASYSLTINSEGNASYGENYQSVQITGAIGTNLNLILTYAGSSEYNTGSTSGRVHDLTISSNTVFWENGVSLAGDLVVDASKIFRAYNISKALTVDGDVTCNGTIDCRGVSEGGDPAGTMAVSFGSLTIASGGTYSATSGTTTIVGAGTIYDAGANPIIFKNSGTLVPNGGTFLDTGAKNHKWQNLGSGDFHHFTVTTGSGRDVYLMDTSGAITFGGDVTINSGNFRGDSSSQDITVTGDFTLAASSDATHAGLAGNHSFGSVTIGANATFSATSGTTTLAGQTGTNNLCFTNSGTFTHNGGTLNITGNTWGTSQYAHIWVGSNQDFGNVTLDAGGAGSKYYQFRAGSTTFYFNDLYIKSGILRDYNNNNTFHIRGNLDVGTRGAGGAQAVLFDSDGRDNDYTTKLILEGIATIYADGQFHVAYGTDGTDGCKIGGIRNVGGTVNAVEQE